MSRSGPLDEWAGTPGRSTHGPRSVPLRRTPGINNNNFSVEETDLIAAAAELLEEVAECNEYRDSKGHAIAEFSAE